MSHASTLIRAARKSRGLTQAQIAARARIDQGDVSRSERGRDLAFQTADRLLAAAGYGLYAAPTRRTDASGAAEEIRTRLREGDRDRALRALIQLNDDLQAEHGLVRGILGLAEPEPTGERIWDAALAALVAWRLADHGLPLPAWVGDPARRLDPPRPFIIDAADPVPDAEDVPPEFLERGVLAWRDTFESI
ncbi:helix-turn-helix domain-containing protein [Agromyces archimandritae]|uniref:Helix-turn-helix transcriptional regulator n=1 Tax=Agromyces archimandritae TaxID=2781962 RepID=A0A975FPL8_9MICO|nr:helix-turn-helix transcriptional regulator [Agromyces archimandritae]QTX05964.1 helix-turn-helix transcriptional regulator [Agromyces archimandritae]